MVRSLSRETRTFDVAADGSLQVRRDTGVRPACCGNIQTMTIELDVLRTVSEQPMNDTDADFAAMVTARYAAMSPLERLQVASSMFDTARAIVASSLPRDLTREERRYLIAKRFYGNELPEAALRAHARHPDSNDP